MRRQSGGLSSPSIKRQKGGLSSPSLNLFAVSAWRDETIGQKSAVLECRRRALTTLAAASSCPSAASEWVARGRSRIVCLDAFPKRPISGMCVLGNAASFCKPVTCAPRCCSSPFSCLAGSRLARPLPSASTLPPSATAARPGRTPHGGPGCRCSGAAVWLCFCGWTGSPV